MHYEGRKAFEGAFKQSFGAELPDTLNSAHRLLVVVSETDVASGRIIEYLSDQHAVDINAVTFQYFDTEESGELLALVFLMEPETVDYQAYTKGQLQTQNRPEVRAVRKERQKEWGRRRLPHAP